MRTSNTRHRLRVGLLHSSIHPLVMASTLMLVACVDDLETILPVASSQPIQSAKELAAGEAVDLGVQFLSDDGEGVDGVEAFFLVSDPTVLVFDGQTAAVSEWRADSGRSDIRGLTARGVATARLLAGSPSEPTDVTVWGGLSSKQSLAEDASASASNLWPFHIRVLPPTADRKTNRGRP